MTIVITRHSHTHLFESVTTPRNIRTAINVLQSTKHWKQSQEGMVHGRIGALILEYDLSIHNTGRVA